ncbi:tyrosine-type recombinase/integrase [Halorubrum ezzemoulense]|uniref:tyrosine-type recombinase/integrase n=1 Tax=Halorubrum ezzemoulense TaxID=337243 RepID=UPI00232AC859|nr:tyrosine-type recombinase/integrase [Halorubrum ezzemoulense]MDB2284461.1 tyrosine-type recombinase/integrase [Halorubrum ezzemoulense]
MPTMDYEAAVTRILAYIESATHIHPENKRLIAEYHRDMVLADISSAQQQKVLAHFKIITDHVGQTRFVDLDKDAIVDLVAWLYTRGTSTSTVVDYKQAIKQFWKWLNDGEDPEETKWIRRGPVEQKRILPQSLLTPADIQALLRVCHNDRDRAFVAVLWETGARIGELIDLKVGHIEQTALGKQMVVSGKTGSRRLLLLESESYLDSWLTAHPNRCPDAPLWCKIDTKQGSPDETISYQYIRLRILARASEQAGIQKPVNPHHFRHSRATYLANYLTEAQMCEWFGWVPGSRVPGRYVHLSGRDIDRAYVSMLENPGYTRLPEADGSTAPSV